jgi:hypothetical protein
MVTCAAAAGCAFVVPGFIAGKPRFIAGLVILETANPHERPAEQLKAHGWADRESATDRCKVDEATDVRGRLVEECHHGMGYHRDS